MHISCRKPSTASELHSEVQSGYDIDVFSDHFHGHFQSEPLKHIDFYTFTFDFQHLQCWQNKTIS